MSERGKERCGDSFAQGLEKAGPDDVETDAEEPEGHGPQGSDAKFPEGNILREDPENGTGKELQDEESPEGDPRRSHGGKENGPVGPVPESRPVVVPQDRLEPLRDAEKG